MHIALVKFGSNCNKRYYFNIGCGVIPKGEYKPHPKYPWWKKWRIEVW